MAYIKINKLENDILMEYVELGLLSYPFKIEDICIDFIEDRKDDNTFKDLDDDIKNLNFKLESYAKRKKIKPENALVFAENNYLKRSQRYLSNHGNMDGFEEL